MEAPEGAAMKDPYASMPDNTYQIPHTTAHQTTSPPILPLQKPHLSIHTTNKRQLLCPRPTLNFLFPRNSILDPLKGFKIEHMNAVIQTCILSTIPHRSPVPMLI